MLQITLWLMLLLQQTAPFRVIGEIIPAAKQRMEWAEIESIDRRFVDYTNVDFEFKKIPGGLYKVTVGKPGVREEQRTIEVRAALADEHGRIRVRIEIRDEGVAKDKLKIGVASLGVSEKAKDEMRL